MTTHTHPVTTPAPPASDAVRYRHPSPRTYRVLMLLRTVLAYCTLVAGCYVGTVLGG